MIDARHCFKYGLSDSCEVAVIHLLHKQASTDKPRNAILILDPSVKNNTKNPNKGLEAAQAPHKVNIPHTQQRTGEAAGAEGSLAGIHYDREMDADALQEEQWAAEAATVHGKPLTLPPQRDKNKARVTDKDLTDPRTQKLRDRKQALAGGRKDSVEGHTPGVGSSPTATMEKVEWPESGQGQTTNSQAGATVQVGGGMGVLASVVLIPRKEMGHVFAIFIVIESVST